METRAEGVAVGIADNGIGMNPEQASRVGERFYRADASGKVSGTGLGMSIVKEIMALHQGSVHIDSTLGQGTSVTLLFVAVLVEGKPSPFPHHGENAMNEATANPVATAADKAAFAESAQLFRYASDLQELIGQFGSLQQRYQQVLEYLGRGEQGDDLLLNTLRQSFDLYLVTDTLGDISHISPAVRKRWVLAQPSGFGDPSQNSCRWTNAPASTRWAPFSGPAATGAIQMRRVTLCHADQDRAVLFDALVLQGGNPERLELFWRPACRRRAQHGACVENCLPLEGSGSTASTTTHRMGAFAL